MAKRKSDHRTISEQEYGITLFRIAEWHKTVRTGLIAAGVFGFAWVTEHYVAKVIVAKSPLETLITAVVVPIVVGFVPPIAIGAWLRNFVKRRLTRLATVEQSVDPNRLSSNVRKDGTHAHDD